MKDAAERCESRAAAGEGENAATAQPSVWRERYADKHRLRRIRELPAGMRPLRHVRIYARHGHFLLQWWDKREKRTLAERIDDDLLAALSRARTIDDRLIHFRSAGLARGGIAGGEMIGKYVAHLEQRADAAEIDPASVARYRSALRHFAAFLEQPDISNRYSQISRADRDLQTAFAIYLNSLQIAPNGSPQARKRPMKARGFVLDVVRSMFAWAADPERGRLLPEGFHNPFGKRGQATTSVAVDPIRELDISLPMAIDLIRICDRFQLALFAPLLLYGLRPGELGWLFQENLADGWLKAACIPELGYMTKGRRDKRFPVPPCLAQLWADRPKGSGLLYISRSARSGPKPLLADATRQELIDEFQQRCGAGRQGAAERRRIRDRLMRDAGQVDYHQIQTEFDKLAKRLAWPACATLKDFRHLFSTALENAGVPDFHRRYFLGQSFGKAPIVAYTHVLKETLRENYQRTLGASLSGLASAISARLEELDSGS